ncbi:MAG: Serine hydroxymethyltransferase [Candidatus Uhrbacteria bacterium GW2011_GWF2_39_13]|uniref:Serine hydroxymethyltransferase n=1 Tax=Candidatus Uhrbacteria bacterium GW2011_GWF2_39_13 TaxID=1618995 RepID=A0A0G0QS56_9BACT|nr:MAG: Serine hydroxymethyltransferase [Candidatus Uhrbacteria bacterium GW2011_GWF2_39_13]HAU65747.1 serine hydroxymethyltransferase [Candidatus Uhrbacteria bacterium]
MKLSSFDPDLSSALNRELIRQQTGLEMIPSENFVSPAVLEALGSIATNKYSEGYPGKRYYGGCQEIDVVEQLAIDRAKQLFGAEHVNVQPLSGAPANLAAYAALVPAGGTILGMDLSHGGHLTHGHPVTFIAGVWNFIRYKTTSEGIIDYDQIEKMAHEHKPHLILVGYSGYSREIDYARIKAIADEVGALTMADIAHIAGLIASGEMNNPVPLFDLVSTTTHKTLRGPRGGMILCKEKHKKAVDKAVFPGLQGGPHENVIAAKAVAFKEAALPEFKQYAQQIKKNAKILEGIFQEKGYKLMFGGTDNHLLLVDVTPKGVTGQQTETALNKAGITVNKNMIPDDTRSPMDPSGIRLGTPALTTRGMKEEEMKRIGMWIDEAITHWSDETKLNAIAEEVKELTSHFPLYPDLHY